MGDNQGMSNKELMLEMFKMQKESAVNMQQMRDKMEQLEDEIITQKEAMKILSSLPSELASINSSLVELKKNSEAKDKNHEDRLRKLEDKAGKLALSTWRKLFEVGLGVAGTMFFGWIFSMFKK